jgi:hypothetical protein
MIDSLQVKNSRSSFSNREVKCELSQSIDNHVSQTYDSSQDAQDCHGSPVHQVKGTMSTHRSSLLKPRPSPGLCVCGSDMPHAHLSAGNEDAQ